MSDLQVSLLIIGIVVVGGVTAFNWFQQWRLRRKLEQAFGDKPEDVLLREEPAREEPAREEPAREQPVREQPHRVEPRFYVPHVPEPEPPPPAPGPTNAARSEVVQALPNVPGFDPTLDYIAAIDASDPVTAAGLAELHTRAAAAGKRFRIVGYNEELGEWEEAGRLSGGRYAHLRVAVQLLSRKGIVDVAALTALSDAVRECAARFSASAHCPDIHTAVVAARDLDAWCADVDIAIGVNVVPPAGGTFAGTRIRALAEGAGFKLEPDGVFHYRDDARHTLFTLDNHEPAPFLPEQIKHLSTSGVTLLLDVPRVAEGQAALELMLRTGVALAEGLGFKLEPDGVFHYRDDSRNTLFTLDNHEPAPFLPEQIKHLSTSGVTLLLDVPRVADGQAALDVMLKNGAALAAGLGGSLVDDNRVPLSDNSVHAIRQQLRSIYAKMEARGMAPGSERALRLFS